MFWRRVSPVGFSRGILRVKRTHFPTKNAQAVSKKPLKMDNISAPLVAKAVQK